MEIRTFRAASLQEALEQVRTSLGPDASVLQTREVKRNRLGLFSQKVIEVEASSAIPLTSHFDSAPSSRPVNRVAAIANTPPEQGGVSQHEAELPSHSADPIQQVQLEFPSHTSGALSAGDDHKSAADTKSPETQDGLQLPQEPNAPRFTQATNRLPAALFETLSELLDAGVDPAEAKQLVQNAAQHCTPEQLEDPWLVKGRIVQLVGADLRVGQPIEVRQAKQEIVAVVGPTGVGKTTTLAKLATRFHFDQGCRVGLITLDTFRPGAVDQLLQYAESLNASLEVVSAADQFLPALQRLRACDIVLLDTAGRSPSDTEQIAVLKSTLIAAQPTSVQLVVSATSSAGHIRAALKHFSPLHPTGLIITKLDEAVGFGSWLSILRQSELPISYLTHGQQVPQDMAVANRRRLASLLLGHANHHSATLLT
jgi:flagellar biosynthesis protein FlhF